MNIPIHMDVFGEMLELANQAYEQFNSEIAGWAHYTKDKGIYKMAPLCKQIAEGMEIDTFPNDILENQNYDMSDMIVQWHSHVTLGTTPSTTDIDLIKKATKLFPLLISVIVNIYGEYSCRIDSRRIGGRYDIITEDVITIKGKLLPYVNGKRADQLAKDVAKKVSIKPEPEVKDTLTTYKDLSYYDGFYGYNIGRVLDNLSEELLKLSKKYPDKIRLIFAGIDQTKYIIRTDKEHSVVIGKYIVKIDGVPSYDTRTLEDLWEKIGDIEKTSIMTKDTYTPADGMLRMAELFIKEKELVFESIHTESGKMIIEDQGFIVVITKEYMETYEKDGGDQKNKFHTKNIQEVYSTLQALSVL